MKWFKPLLNPQSWLKPKTIVWVIAAWLIYQFGGLAVKWTELNMEELFKSAGISVNYGKIESLTSSGLKGYADRMGCGMFERDLDDDILTDYFVIPLEFRNFTHNPVGPMSFLLDAGCPDAKIIDVQYAVRAPIGKRIAVRHNLPKLKWTLPTNSLHLTAHWDSQPYNRFNVFFSVARDRGFGQVTPLPIESNEFPLLLAPNPNLSHYFFRITAENMSGEATGEVMVAPNPIYLAKPPQSPNKPGPARRNVSPANPNATLSDNAIMGYLEGRTTISMETGLDPGASVVVYALGKVASGQSIRPSVKMNGEPGVLFKEENPAPRFDVPFISLLNPSKLAITPLEVRAVAASGKVVFFWNIGASSNYSGIKVFRSRERQLGDYADLGNKIFDGFGSTNALEFEYFQQASGPGGAPQDATHYQDFFDHAPAESNPVVTPKPPFGFTHAPPAPMNLRLMGFRWSQTRRGLVHFIETPPEQGVVFTYTFYAFDPAGNESFPIVVNASLDSSATNCTFKVLP